MSQELADTMLDDQPQKEKINLLGLSASRLSEFFEEIGEKSFAQHKSLNGFTKRASVISKG